MSNKYIKSIAIPLFFIFTFFCVGCGGTSSEKTLSQGSNTAYDEFSIGKIKGTVVAADTGLGLSGAIVEAYQCQAITDNNGNYLLEGIPAGDHNVTVRITGYNAIVREKVRVFNGQITENINFSLSYATNEYSPDFKILSLHPNWGTDGDLVTVLCSGCGRKAGRITFNGVDAKIIDWNSNNDGRVKVYLPNNVETGPVKLIINNETSKDINAPTFIARPVILGLHPDVASGGQTIVVRGRNFSPIYNRNKFQLNGQDCYTISDDSSIYNQKIVLPGNARTGKITVKLVDVDISAIDGVGEATLTVAPKLVHITPKRSTPGALITLYGYNFGNNLNAFKINIGGYELAYADIVSLTDTTVSFYAPSNSIIGAGTTVEVSVQVNNAKSNSLMYTALNTADMTISEYGIYDFNTVSVNNRLKLARLKPTDRIAFLSTLSGNYTQVFPDDYEYYVVSAYMGGNVENVPSLPESVRASQFGIPLNNDNTTVGRSRKNYNSSIVKPSDNIRAAMNEPASETIEVHVRNFKSESPYDAANDILQTGKLIASTTHALVYLEQSVTGISKTACEEIGKEFDKTYEAIKRDFGVLDVPEGNIDDQERILIFITDLVEAKPDKTAYFDPRDKQKQQVNSNGTEIIFASPLSYKDSADNFQGELAYALHEMMYYNQRWDTPKAIYYGTNWQSAGLSMMARQSSGRGYSQGNTIDLEKVRDYLKKPEQVRLDSWSDSISNSNYGLQFLFAQYLYDRCKGWDTVKVLESGRSFTVKNGLEDIEMNILPEAVPACSGLSDFFNDFCLAMYCDHLSFSGSLPGYNPDKYGFKSISLRTNGINGLQGKSLNENPVNKVVYQIPAFGCSLLSYSGGNGGDLEFEISSKPDRGIFKTWVIYYSTENPASN